MYATLTHILQVSPESCNVAIATTNTNSTIVCNYLVITAICGQFCPINHKFLWVLLLMGILTLPFFNTPLCPSSTAGAYLLFQHPNVFLSKPTMLHNDKLKLQSDSSRFPKRRSASCTSRFIFIQFYCRSRLFFFVNPQVVGIGSLRFPRTRDIFWKLSLADWTCVFMNMCIAVMSG